MASFALNPASMNERDLVLVLAACEVDAFESTIKSCINSEFAYLSLPYGDLTSRQYGE